MPQNIEEKLVFAISPEGQGDGVPLLIVGLPAGAWEYMRDGKTHHFDLTKLGLPVKMIFFGAENHDAAMKALQEGMKARGEAYLDERQRDFSIEPKEPVKEPVKQPVKEAGKITRDPEYPSQYAQLVTAFNRCADGHASAAVLNAALQMVAASIGVITRSREATLEQTLAYSGQVAECIAASVEENFQRAAKPADVVVKPS
jgi:hypothetical protein